MDVVARSLAKILQLRIVLCFCTGQPQFLGKETTAYRKVNVFTKPID